MTPVDCRVPTELPTQLAPIRAYRQEGTFVQRNAEWRVFWDEYWKKDLLPNLHTVNKMNIHYEVRLSSGLSYDPPVCREDVWPLYVRECYKTSYDFLLDTKNNRGSGVLITGSPGIGKSFFLIYALARRLMEGQTTILHRGIGVYVFDAAGVWCMKNPLHLSQVRLQPEDNDFLWCLYDDTAPPLDLYSSESCFLVHATSPKASRYREWVKQRHPPLWYMDLWDSQEFKASAAQFGNTLSDEEIKDRIHRRGPCPRDHQVPDVTFQGDLERAIVSLTQNTSWEEIVTLSGHRDQFTHTLFTMKPTEDHSKFVWLFKTPLVYKELLRRYENAEALDLMKWYNRFFHMTEAAVFLGWMFERYALLKTSSSNAGGSILQMKPSRDRERKWTADPRKSSSTIQLPFVKRTIIYLDDVKDDSGSEDASSIDDDNDNDDDDDDAMDADDKTYEPPCEPADPVEPDDGKAIERYYYIPINTRNPLFDAFFFELSDRTLFIWVIQITTNAFTKKPGSAKGYRLLKHVSNQVADQPAWDRTEFKYLLVVPDKQITKPINYRLPLDRKNNHLISGDVYVYLTPMD